MEHTPFRTLAQIEKEHVLRVLLHCEGDVGKASQILGMSQTSLYRRLQLWKIRSVSVTGRMLAKRSEQLAAIANAIEEIG